MNKIHTDETHLIKSLQYNLCSVFIFNMETVYTVALDYLIKFMVVKLCSVYNVVP